MNALKMLDCFCGLGGASQGFADEGFDCTGIDITKLGYPYRFIQADMNALNGEQYKGFDVIWGSPPCRDFSIFAKRFGKTWKANPPNPQNGLKLVQTYLQFVMTAKPTFWVMENVPALIEALGMEPRFIANLRRKNQMVRAFWGNFPNFLLPRDNKNEVMRYRSECNEKNQVMRSSKERAKIPLPCSKTFAMAFKQALGGG